MSRAAVPVPSLPAQIRAAREAAGLTQAELGAACGLVGPGAQTLIAHLEAGRRSPRVAHLEAIARATGTPLTITG